MFASVCMLTKVRKRGLGDRFLRSRLGIGLFASVRMLTHGGSVDSERSFGASGHGLPERFITLTT